MTTMTLQEKKRRIKKEISKLKRELGEVNKRISRGGKYLYIGKYLLYEKDSSENIYIHVTDVRKGKVIHDSILVIDGWDCWAYLEKIDLPFMKQCKEIPKEVFDREDNRLWDAWSGEDGGYVGVYDE